MYKLDLHTHSILSPDGGLREKDYEQVLATKVLDYLAITDHNEITFAQDLHKRLGNQVIVGEEIMTTHGEMIGLYVSERVPPGLSPRETARKIHEQHALVLIPHPFETFRKGIALSLLEEIHGEIDIVEVFNGRSLQPATRKNALALMKEYHYAPACNSDAHCRLGIGKTYSQIAEKPMLSNLVQQLCAAQRHEEAAPRISYLCPKVNRLKKMLNIQ